MNIPARNKMRQHETMSGIQCCFEPLGNRIVESDSLLEKVYLAIKAAHIGFFEFTIKKQKLFKIRPIRHLGQ